MTEVWVRWVRVRSTWKPVRQRVAHAKLLHYLAAVLAQLAKAKKSIQQDCRSSVCTHSD